MEIAKYYNNPFRDDDDAACYAEVGPEEVDICTPITSPVAPMPLHYRDSQPLHDDDIHYNLSSDLQHGSTLSVDSLRRNPDAFSLQILKEELQSAKDTMHKMQCEYESTIESLRAQAALEEDAKRVLLAEVSNLESRARSLIMEKKTLEHTVHEERRQNELLKRRITDLEAQWTDLHPEHPETTRPATVERANTAKDALAYKRGPLLTQQTNPEPRPVLSAKELEAELLRHLQTRSALVGQMQKIEGLRMRTAAEIKRKANTQQRLEEEEKEIGRIRLQLRSQMTHAR